MSYYILPKTFNNIYLNLIHTSENSYKFILDSYLYKYSTIITQLKHTIDNLDPIICSIDEIVSKINPCQYIFTNIPRYNLKISKLNSKDQMFYDLVEILYNFNLLDNNLNTSVKSLHIGSKSTISIDFIQYYRKDCNFDTICQMNTLTSNMFKPNFLNNINFNLIIIDVTSFISSDNIIEEILLYLALLFKHISLGGNCIINTDLYLSKNVIEFIYILTSMFEKTYVIKPNTCNVNSFEKYIICKNFKLKKECYNVNYKLIKKYF